MRKIFGWIGIVTMVILLTACTGTKVIEEPGSVDPVQEGRVNDPVVAGEVTIEQAEKIALEQANLNKEDITLVRAERVYEDALEKYAIDFRTDEKKYEYEINALTGEIIECDFKVLDNTATTQTPATTNESVQTPISVEEAKAIALQHANVTEDTARFIRTDREYEDGVEKYEIDFYVNNIEYDYEIDVYTGVILQFDKG